MAGLDAAGIQQVGGMIQSFALKIIGGIPILKNSKGSTNEMLKLPKHLDIGNIGGMLSQVLQNGVGSLMQNPLAAAASLAGGDIAGAAAAISGIAGGGGVAAALGNLQGSIGAASSLAGSLSGAAAAAGMPTNLDLLSHAGVASGLGTDLPAALSTATAAAPLLMGPAIASAGQQAASIASAVVAGTMAPEAATAAISALQAGIDATVSGSTAAIAGLAARGPDLAAVSCAVACLVPGAVPVELAQAMHGCFTPAGIALAAQVAADHYEAVSSAEP